MPFLQASQPVEVLAVMPGGSCYAVVIRTVGLNQYFTGQIATACPAGHLG